MHLLNTKQQKEGFTIIEVIIVLAIVGLIILIVFITIPAVQRNARNFQRRQDVSRTLSYLQEVTANNGGKYPNSCNNLQADCFMSDVQTTFYTHNKERNKKAISYDKDFDPLDGNTIDLNDTDQACTSAEIYGPSSPIPASGEICNDTDYISVRAWAKCDEDNTFTQVGASKKNVAAQFAIETGSGYILACLDA